MENEPHWPKENSFIIRGIFQHPSSSISKHMSALGIFSQGEHVLQSFYANT